MPASQSTDIFPSNGSEQGYITTIPGCLSNLSSEFNHRKQAVSQPRYSTISYYAFKHKHLTDTAVGKWSPKVK